MASIFSNYPPGLSSKQKGHLTRTIKDWSIQHGLTVRPQPSFVPSELDSNGVLATTAPVTLFPSPFSRKCFDQARSIQEAYNELYAAISNDEDWLEGIMKELIDVDDFVANLWGTHLAVKKEGYVQSLSLGLFRSDYMHDTSSSSDPIKQVEFNTISSSFGGLSDLVTSLHTELIEHGNSYPSNSLFNKTVPPPNSAVSTLTKGLSEAHAAYGPHKSKAALPLCILFLVQDHERNVFDQLALSSYLWSTFKITSFRLPVSSILTSTTIPSYNPSRPLIYHPPHSPSTPYEATTVYFRALYTPTDYNTSTSWTARSHLERSAAIKCPTVLLQLAGSKKVQQVLTSTAPDHLSHFLPEASKATLTALRSTFAPQYALTDQEGLSIALDDAKASNYVLKPQREGGGNNIYRSNIPPYLRSIPEDEYKRWVLMELIHPPPEARNTVLKSDGSVVGGGVISELGIFGACLWDSGVIDGNKAPRILHNKEGGYLLRTKGKESDEGGVAAGFSSLDSLILYDE